MLPEIYIIMESKNEKKEPEKELPKKEPVEEKKPVPTTEEKAETAHPPGNEEKKKKKKKKKPKSMYSLSYHIEKDEAKTESSAPGAAPLEEEKKAKASEETKLAFERKLDNSIFRKLGSWKEGEYKQT